MHSRSLLSGAVVALVLPATALAQTPECEAYAGNTGRVCAAAVDGTRALHPVAGILVSGGNPVLGTGKTLGGLGHFSVTARANAVKVVLPDVGYTGATGTVPSSEKSFAPAPVVEGAAGIWRGLPSGLLSLDALVSAQLLPTGQLEHLAVDQGARRIGDVALGLGFGARIGILRGISPLPAVSISVMRRDIPQLRYGDLAAGDQFRYAVDLHATNVRLVGSTQLAAFALAAGLGWDRYTGDASIQFRDQTTGAVAPEIAVRLRSERLLGFADAGVSLGLVELVGELGWQGGKDQHLTTDFQDFDPAHGRLFASLGVRVGI